MSNIDDLIQGVILWAALEFCTTSKPVTTLFAQYSPAYSREIKDGDNIKIANEKTSLNAGIGLNLLSVAFTENI